MLLAGIDEAGYGPTLGPLAVALSIFRLPQATDSLPDLWDLLSTGICREPGRGGRPDAHGRVAVADSKRLKLANSVRTTHPLVHLERGVLALIPDLPADDAALFARVGALLSEHPCYAGEPVPLPLASTPGELAIARSLAQGALEGAGIAPVELRCELVHERRFNDIIRSTGNKAETVADALRAHVARVWELVTPGERSGLVCDRLGGRACYEPLISRWLPGASVEIVEESAARSRYVATDPMGKRLGIAFLTEGESAHLPVALASMLAKFARELAMVRFNRYWTGHALARARLEVKPTAGYALDARRWLDEMGPTLDRADREALVRLA